jgi:hypothetical protein
VWPPLDLARRGSLDNVQAACNCSASTRIVVARSTAAGAVIAQSRLWSGSPPRRQSRPDILVAKLVDDLKRHDKCGADIYDRRHDEK